MCVAVPGKVLKIDGDTAVCSFLGAQKQVNVMLIENIAIGDYVLVHVGCAIEKIDEEEAEKTLEMFQEIIKGGAYYAEE